MSRFVVLAASIVPLLLSAVYAYGHSTDHPQHGSYSQSEMSWMKRQRNVAGQWCCGPENITLLEDPHIRVRRGQYEVHILNQWVPVPPSAMHRYDPSDPSPFEGQVLLFFSTQGTAITIWCLTSQAGG